MQTVAVGAAHHLRHRQRDVGGPGGRRRVPADRPPLPHRRGALADRLPAPPGAGDREHSAAAGHRRADRGSGRRRPRQPGRARSARDFAEGSASALIGPFQQAILPDLVPAAGVPRGRLAQLGRVERSSRIVGPALAGITVAAFGYWVAFVAKTRGVVSRRRRGAPVRQVWSPPSGIRTGLLSSLREGFITP